MQTIKIFLLSIFLIHSSYSMDLPLVPDPVDEKDEKDSLYTNAMLAHWLEWVESKQTDNSTEELKPVIEPSSGSSSAPAELPGQSSKRDPNYCEICNTIIKNHLRRHLYTHTRENLYRCSEGDYAGNQLCNTRRHIWSRHSPAIGAYIIETINKENSKKTTSKIISVDYPKAKSCIHCKRKFFTNYEHKRHQSRCSEAK